MEAVRTHAAIRQPIARRYHVRLGLGSCPVVAAGDDGPNPQDNMRHLGITRRRPHEAPPLGRASRRFALPLTTWIYLQVLL